MSGSVLQRVWAWMGVVALVLPCGPAAASDAGPEARITSRDGSEMVLVAAGDFVMGSGEGRDDEAPPHARRLPAFYIDRTEVSNAQYARFVAETGHTPPVTWAGPKPPPKTEKLPVTTITWSDAMRYALWAGKRLPTEAEWEKAARGTDGRRYPWGHADDPSRRNLGDSEDLGPVDGLPAGAAPCGAVNLCGNAWEWTADWYGAYPGSDMPSVHFGRKYKTIRGGGAIYFYGIANTGTTFHRARILPYGAHDGLGFRCAQDPPGAAPPYDARSLLKEAEEQLQGVLREPAVLSFEREYAACLDRQEIPLAVVGDSGRQGHVRTGVPLPAGLVAGAPVLQVLAGDRPLATQTTALSRWPDGSVRWALVDFVGEAARSYTLRLKPDQPATPIPGPLVRLTETPDAVTIDTGVVTLRITRAGLLEEIRREGHTLAARLDLRMKLAGEPGAELTARPADRLDVEAAGPVHGVVRVAGSLGAGDGPPSSFRYDLRIHATAGSPRVNLLLTLINHVKREAPPIAVADASAWLRLPGRPALSLYGNDRHGVEPLPAGERMELLQPDDLRYRVLGDGKEVARGTRLPGWLAFEDQGWTLIGSRHFWQNCPRSLALTQQSVGLRLWAGLEPFEWEGGLAKTHEMVIDWSPDKPAGFEMEPLRAVLPPAWVCGTQAAGPLVPRCRESMTAFPYWELLREWDMARWVRSMPAGMRDFGDAYYGGPYKGKNAYANLEYDVPWNFLFQFLRTGEVWYLQHAEVQARHQADIDVDHFTGRQWKHSPLHTTTEADLGHVFIRGMLLHYLLTGERRSLEAAVEVGNWLAPQVEKLKGIGNERQIGWSLYALTGLYEATRDEQYLKAATTCALKLHELQEPSGKFRIRWDNRISFFNGIAMNGLLEVYKNNPDERIARTILRLGERTLGQYPEYALRTMNAFCWAAERTRDPRFIDVVARTWETSMEYLMPREASTAETHAWYFPRFALKQGLFPLLDAKRDPLPDPKSWRTLRIEADDRGMPPGMPSEPPATPRVELFARTTGAAAAPVLVIAEGLVPSRVEVYRLDGSLLGRHELVGGLQPVRAAALELPAGAGVCRLKLLSDGAVTWQIHHDAASAWVLHDRLGRHIPGFYPKAFGFLREGAREVVIRFEAMGEGFHSVVLYDSAGNPVGAVRHFVDLGDPGRYEMTLKAPVGGPSGGWALEVFNARVLAVDGLLPYWSCRAEDLFNPELSKP